MEVLEAAPCVQVSPVEVWIYCGALQPVSRGTCQPPPRGLDPTLRARAMSDVLMPQESAHQPVMCRTYAQATRASVQREEWSRGLCSPQRGGAGTRRSRLEQSHARLVVLAGSTSTSDSDMPLEILHPPRDAAVLCGAEASAPTPLPQSFLGDGAREFTPLPSPSANSHRAVWRQEGLAAENVVEVSTFPVAAATGKVESGKKDGRGEGDAGAEGNGGGEGKVVFQKARASRFMSWDALISLRPAVAGGLGGKVLVIEQVCIGCCKVVCILLHRIIRVFSHPTHLCNDAAHAWRHGATSHGSGRRSNHYTYSLVG